MLGADAKTDVVKEALGDDVAEGIVACDAVDSLLELNVKDEAAAIHERSTRADAIVSLNLFLEKTLAVWHRKLLAQSLSLTFISNIFKDLEREEWYHGYLPFEDIVGLLKNDGDFLIRGLDPDSQHQARVSDPLRDQAGSIRREVSQTSNHVGFSIT
ncbi:unnamed protein product [Nippostrongylus brasiliensis]|uniref:SH2 domain-containing protein n=1 Tax=Nippostrongylus brasiliensis TaxID=27835 RepID=A0A0N4Y8C9_NIPBR|nr:unnamed protein product [Nippostrongylus brasiliensis]